MVENFDIQSVFWWKWKLNLRSLIQLSNTLSIELTRIYNIQKNYNRSFSKSLNSNNVLGMPID